jgi:hypothetical protein
MFGSFGTDDAGSNTIFDDGTDTKSVVWQTTQPITLYGVNIFSSNDSQYGPGRAIKTFSLYYFDDASQQWMAIISNYDTGVVSSTNQGEYTIFIAGSANGWAGNFMFDPVTASKFKAEFTQFNLSGARVNELDAITAVPIPAAVWLLGSGLIGLIGVRRFRK